MPHIAHIHDSACQCNRRHFLAGSAAAAASLAFARWSKALDAISAGTQPSPAAVPFAAPPLPLSAVRITGGPLKHAQELGIQNLLKLEPDRMMFHLRDLAGLKPKAPQGYASWDGPGRNLTGHIAGHYLSAVSYMYAATGDDRFQQRADYLVDEMIAVQDKRGNGYIGALMGGGGRGGAPVVDGMELFQQVSQGRIQASAFDLNGMWSPWYVQHKIFAGLRDAHRHAASSKALETSVKFAAWAESIVAPLNPDQTQKMLSCEFGGINESFADLYADTGDARWLALSRKFIHHAIVDPLANQHDILGGKHGNTQVPKLLGELARYIAAGDSDSGAAAKFFWEAVVNHHTFATGGHGYDESFDAPDKLSDEIDGHNHRNPDRRTCESCNVYNMVKLSRLLFALKPDERIAAFHERALFNHVLASINFNDGQLCYMVPIGLGVTHEYQGTGFTCCVGTGLENHALHADGIYSEAPGNFWINQFAPSTARSDLLGLNIEQQTNFPEGQTSKLTLTLDSPREITLNLRRPAWAGDGYTLSINNRPVDPLPAPGSYAELKQTWKSGDVIAFSLPRRLRTEPLPDNANRMAVLHGPIVLATDFGVVTRGLGRRGPTTSPSEPILTANPSSVEEWLTPVADQPGEFRAATGAGRPDITFRPFYQLSDHRYGIYCDVYTQAEWEARKPPATEPAVRTN